MSVGPLLSFEDICKKNYTPDPNVEVFKIGFSKQVNIVIALPCLALALNSISVINYIKHRKKSK